MNKIPLEEFGSLYNKAHSSSAPFIEVVNSYNAWIRYQELSEATPKKEKTKYKLVTWNDYPTADLWIEETVKHEKRKITSANAMRKHMELPWYERILTEEGNCNIKDQLIEAFITSKEGEKIRENLLQWDITAENLFDAIKHFAPYVTDRKFTDDEIKAFLVQNKKGLDFLGAGVCCDGSRVFRTLKWACEMFYKQMT